MDSKKITEKIAESLNLTQDTASDLLNGFVELMLKHGKELNTLNVTGFGVFETKIRPEREALHPSSGEPLLVPPKVTMSFKPSQLLKTKLKYEDEDQHF